MWKTAAGIKKNKKMFKNNSENINYKNTKILLINFTTDSKEC